MYVSCTCFFSDATVFKKFNHSSLFEKYGNACHLMFQLAFFYDGLNVQNWIICNFLCSVFTEWTEHNFLAPFLLAWTFLAINNQPLNIFHSFLYQTIFNTVESACMQCLKKYIVVTTSYLYSLELLISYSGCYFR